MSAASTSPIQVRMETADSTRVAPGTNVTFQASASGTATPVEFEYHIRSSNSEWSTSRGYSTNGTWTMGTAFLPNDIYYVTAWARRLGSTVAYESAAVPLEIVVTPLSKAAGVTLTSDGISTTVIGERVQFTANGTGGTGQYEYQYRLRSDLVDWHIVRPFSTTATWIWDTSTYPANRYFVEVKSRSAGSPADWEAYSISSAQSLIPRNSPSGVLLTSNQPTRVAPGTPVVFSASSQGANVEYEYHIRSSSSEWRAANTYSTNGTWTFSTTGLASDIYYVTAWARQVGSRSNFEAAAAPLIV
ncbi:MAG: hypothetical protein FJ267_15995, partial [Planctomycetes bacterium]|nr:hypothetical protein [Planctomycetota bacterium]